MGGNYIELTREGISANIGLSVSVFKIADKIYNKCFRIVTEFAGET